MESRTEKVTAQQVMSTNVKTVPTDAILRAAARLLHDNIGGAPVIDPVTGRRVGIISESDLLNTVKTQAALPHIGFVRPVLASEESLKRIYEDGAKLLVEEVMTRRVTSVTPGTPIRKVGDILVREKINRVPVVDAEQRLVGIITRHDLLRTLFRFGD